MNCQRNAGFSLLEVLVTMVLLSVGLLGLATLQTSALKGGFDAGQRSQASWMVQELVERMRANPDAQTSGYTAAVANADLCNDGPVKICSDHFDGEGVINAAGDCTSDEVAEFDVWELTCGHGLDGITTDTLQQLTGDGLSLQCVDSDPGDADPCSTGSIFTATLDWISTEAEATHAEEDPHKSMSFEVRI